MLGLLMKTAMSNKPTTAVPEALDQALRVRGSRDFPDRAAYERFVAELVKQRNQTKPRTLPRGTSSLGPTPTGPALCLPRATGSCLALLDYPAARQYLLGAAAA